MKYNYSQEELEKKKKELMDKLNGLDSRYNELLPNLDKTNKNGFNLLEKDKTTDEELRERAARAAETEYSGKAEKAEKETNEKTEQLREAIKGVLSDAESKKQNTSDNYALSEKRIEEDAAKRGVSRSSIANGSVAELESQKLGELSKIDEQAQAKSYELSAQIDELKAKLEELIKNYESEKKAYEEEKFNEAKTERDKKNAEADKYNNSIRQFEIQNSENLRSDPDYRSEADNVKLNFDKQKIAAVVDFYNSFADKNKALEDFLSNDGLRKSLGSYYDYCLRIIYNS